LKLDRSVTPEYEEIVNYSNRARREEACAPQCDSLALVEERATSRAARASWARLIKQVYESDPLPCPRCGNEMRVIALIDDQSVIRHILEQLGRYVPRGLAEKGPAQQTVSGHPYNWTPTTAVGRSWSFANQA
jgi:hypothetical protein